MSNSDSEESTAHSGPKDLCKCRHCHKAFSSGQALGGHQNAHRIHNRVVVRKLIHIIQGQGNINPSHGAVPAEVIQPADAAAAAVADCEGTVGGGEGHFGIVHPGGGGFVVDESGGGYFHELVYDPYGMIRAEKEDGGHHHQPEHAAQEGVIDTNTKDFLGEWIYKDINGIGNYVGAVESGRSSERTVTDPINVRVCGDEEEAVRSELDLELKLGTGF